MKLSERDTVKAVIAVMFGLCGCFLILVAAYRINEIIGLVATGLFFLLIAHGITDNIN